MSRLRNSTQIYIILSGGFLLKNITVMYLIHQMCHIPLSLSESDEFFEEAPISNWYVENLVYQLYSLQKLPKQTVKNFIGKAKSLTFALSRVGHPIGDNDLMCCIADGIDQSLHDFFQYYYQMERSLSFDFLFTLLCNHEQISSQACIPNFTPIFKQILKSSVSTIVSFVSTFDHDKVKIDFVNQTLTDMNIYNREVHTFFLSYSGAKFVLLIQ